MPAPQSSFDATLFRIQLQGIAGFVQVTPRWIDRNEKTFRGSVRVSITGHVALQEIDRKWKPVTLEFKQSNLPGALADQTLLNLFMNARQAGGLHTLVLEGTTKSVMFDWDYPEPVEYAEMTPTGEADATQGRLYEVVLHLKEIL